MLTDLSGDMRCVLRSWRRTPGFAATIVLTLTLGLGLAAGIFAFADGYLFRPLPFPSAERLFFVRDPDGQIVQTLRASETMALRATAVGHLGFVEWGGETAVPSLGEMQIGNRRVALRVQGVSEGFAETLQLPLTAGRAFTPRDHAGGSPVPVWLSYRVWQREFGGDRTVLGRTFTVIGPRTATGVVVVGIMAREVTAFDLNNPPPELVAPSREPDPRTLGPSRLSFPLVRLPEDMSVEQAEAAIASALQAVAPGPAGKIRRVRLRSLYEYQVYGGRPTAQVFGAGGVLILLLVTINLVHLLLTRGVARAAEVATRAALGASRWRIARLFFVESLALGAAAIAGGLMLGAWLTHLIAAAVPAFPTGGRNLALIVMGFDLRVVAMAVLLGLVVSMLGTAWPAWRAARRPLVDATRSAASVGRHIPSRLSRAILASQVAVAAVILIGATFMGLGIWRYLNQPLGFEIQDRVSILPELTGSDPAAQAASLDWAAVVDAIRQVPGIRAVSPDDTPSAGPVDLEDGRKLESLRAASVTQGYFDAWGIRSVAGRLFSSEEIAANSPVSVVDEKFARIAWPDQPSIGKVIRVAGDSREVIGVIAPKRSRLSGEQAGIAYVPGPRVEGRVWSLVAWAPGVDLDDLATRLQGRLRGLGPDVSVRVKRIAFDDMFARDAGEALFQRPIVALFGVCTFMLAGIGLFGVVAYLAEQRRREFGIRLALGARPSHLWRDVVRQGLVPAVAGLAVGLGVASLLENVVEATVFGWQSSGPVAMGIVAVALLLVAVVAATGPARRVLRIDPAVVLRSE